MVDSFIKKLQIEHLIVIQNTGIWCMSKRRYRSPKIGIFQYHVWDIKYSDDKYYDIVQYDHTKKLEDVQV